MKRRIQRIKLPIMSCSRRGAHASILGMAVLAISGSGARSSPPLPVGEWPTPNRTFRVATRAAFARRYTQAVGGDLILVGNGVDLGSFTFDRNGDNAEQPIIVAAADRAPGPASAFFSGRAEVPGRFNRLRACGPWASRWRSPARVRSCAASCSKAPESSAARPIRAKSVSMVAASGSNIARSPTATRAGLDF